MAKELRAYDGNDWDLLVREIKAFDGSDWDTDIKEVLGWTGSVWQSLWLKSNPATQTFLPTFSSTYRVAGNNYNSSQLDQRRRLMYYGRTSAFTEGGLTAFDDAAIRAFLDERPVVSKIIVRTAYQHSYSSAGETVTVGWHNDASLSTDPNNGWVEPASSYRRTVHYGKNDGDVATRVETVWEGADAKAVGDLWRNGTYRGFGVWIPGAAELDWGWGVGYAEKSTGDSGGVPVGYTPVTTSDRMELIITADYV